MDGCEDGCEDGQGARPRGVTAESQCAGGVGKEEAGLVKETENR